VTEWDFDLARAVEKMLEGSRSSSNAKRR
jgi:hypothetical protein